LIVMSPKPGGHSSGWLRPKGHQVCAGGGTVGALTQDRVLLDAQNEGRAVSSGAGRSGARTSKISWNGPWVRTAPTAPRRPRCGLPQTDSTGASTWSSAPDAGVSEWRGPEAGWRRSECRGR
jgi:hypothetical protein